LSKRLPLLTELIAEIFQADGGPISKDLLCLTQVPAPAGAFPDHRHGLEADVGRTQRPTVSLDEVGEGEPLWPNPPLLPGRIVQADRLGDAQTDDGHAKVLGVVLA